MHNIARKNNHGCDVFVRSCREANALAYSKQTFWPAVIGLRKYFF